MQKTQERCAEVMARCNYIDQPGVRELIDMLPELMRDVMKGQGSTSSPDGVRSGVDACMPAPTQSFPPTDARSTTAGGYPCETQDAAAAAASTSQQQQQQQHKSQRSVAARHEYPRTTVPQPEHFNYAYKIPVGTTTTTTTTTDPGYFSADVESLGSSHPQQHHPAPAEEDDAENHHGGRLHPSMKQQPSYHDPSNYPTYYPSWGCSGGAMASWMQQQQQPSHVVGSSAQADRSPTDFAGGWANEGGPLYAGAERFDGGEEEEFNLDDFIHA
ncbi:hypothetical protein SLS54_005069 [Diplodia seriata]